MNESASPQRPIRSQYEDFMRHVHLHGVHKGDRTGTGTRSDFGHHTNCNFGSTIFGFRGKWSKTQLVGSQL